MANKPTPHPKKRTKPGQKNSANRVYAQLNPNPNQPTPRIRQRNKRATPTPN